MIRKHPHRAGEGEESVGDVVGEAEGQVPDVVNYIANQEEHHRRYTFREEFEAWLRQFGAEITPFSLPEPLE